MTEHWLDRKLRLHQPINPNQFYNYPRISAPTMVKLMALKNKLTGHNHSILEESLIYDEKNEQVL